MLETLNERWKDVTWMLEMLNERWNDVIWMLGTLNETLKWCYLNGKNVG